MSIPNHLPHKQPSPIAVSTPLTTSNSSTTSTQVLLLPILPAACTICLTYFFAALRSLLDHHAPLLAKTNKSSRTAPTPWITTEILSLKSARSRLKHTYIASHSIFDLKLLRSATNRYHKFIAAAKKSFYASLVQSSSSKSRALWTTINNILQRTANRSLPTLSSLAARPQLFATYFSDKISKLHFNLQTNPSSTSSFSPTFTPSSTPLSLLPPYSKSTIYFLNPLTHTVISILFLPAY